MTLTNSLHLAGAIYKVSVVGVSPDPQCLRPQGANLNESITLGQFDQFYSGRRAGICNWWLLALSIKKF